MIFLYNKKKCLDIFKDILHVFVKKIKNYEKNYRFFYIIFVIFIFRKYKCPIQITFWQRHLPNISKYILRTVNIVNIYTSNISLKRLKWNMTNVKFFKNVPLPSAYLEIREVYAIQNCISWGDMRCTHCEFTNERPNTMLFDRVKSALDQTLMLTAWQLVSLDRV